MPHLAIIRPWVDPVVDDVGHDPRSRYVETFWLGVLGPTSTWLLRRLVADLEQAPDGYEIDLDVAARSLGLRYAPGRTTTFTRAFQRCVTFGIARHIVGGFAVRRRIPDVGVRHLTHLPTEVQQAHHQWVTTTVRYDDVVRAHGLAAAMLELGDDSSLIEHRLVALGIRDAVAAEVAENARQLVERS